MDKQALLKGRYNSILLNTGHRKSTEPSRIFQIYQYEPPRVRKPKKHASYFALDWGTVQADLMHATRFNDKRFKYVILFVEMISKKVYLFCTSSKKAAAWKAAIVGALEFYGCK